MQLELSVPGIKYTPWSNGSDNTRQESFADQCNCISIRPSRVGPYPSCRYRALMGIAANLQPAFFSSRRRMSEPKIETLTSHGVRVAVEGCVSIYLHSSFNYEIT